MSKPELNLQKQKGKKSEALRIMTFNLNRKRTPTRNRNTLEKGVPEKKTSTWKGWYCPAEQKEPQTMCRGNSCWDLDPFLGSTLMCSIYRSPLSSTRLVDPNWCSDSKANESRQAMMMSNAVHQRADGVVYRVQMGGTYTRGLKF